MNLSENVQLFAVTPHQDATYLYTDPVKVVGFWIALNDANLSNGCIKFIPGSHRSGVHRRYIKNPDKTSDELLIYDSQAPVYQKNVFVPVPVPKGNALKKITIQMYNYQIQLLCDEKTCHKSKDLISNYFEELHSVS